MSAASVHFKKPTRKEQRYARDLAQDRATRHLEQTRHRDRIIELRPDWNRDLLNLVTHGHGSLDNPGLYDILRTLQEAACLTSQFTKK
jgi:hypothetical protein